MSRVQLALNVSDLEASINFYTALFKVEPHKLRPGYANFEVAEPPLKLVLIEQSEADRGTGPAGALNHLGVEVETDEVLIILESMKMEIPVLAPRKGRVAEFRVNEGESVAEDQIVLLFEPS